MELVSLRLLWQRTAKQYRLRLCTPSLFIVSQKSMREGGLLFIVHYPKATQTCMFQIIEVSAKSLILPWFDKRVLMFMQVASAIQFVGS